MNPARRRECIIEHLAYPRDLIRTAGIPEDCRHGGEYCPADPGCRTCLYDIDCRWLCTVDQCSALPLKTTDQLADSLAFAVEYVTARILDLRHNSHTCHCDHCQWLRSARRLLNGDAV
jgi:hypothetical protein